MTDRQPAPRRPALRQPAPVTTSSCDNQLFVTQSKTLKPNNKLIKSLNSSCVFFDRGLQPGRCNQQVRTMQERMQRMFDLRQAAVNHSFLALIVIYAFCTVGAGTEEKKTR